MALNVGKDITALQRRTVPGLRREYAGTVGEGMTSRHKQFLIPWIIWRLQANQEGGLSERARRHARELAADSDVRVAAQRARVSDPDGPTRIATMSGSRRESVN